MNWVGRLLALAAVFVIGVAVGARLDSDPWPLLEQSFVPGLVTLAAAFFGAFSFGLGGLYLKAGLGIGRNAVDFEDGFGTGDTGFAGLDKSNDLVDGLDTFHQQALEILKSDKTRKALDLTTENGYRLAAIYSVGYRHPLRDVDRWLGALRCRR